MANLFLTFTRADVPKMQKLVLWLYNLPVRGTHVGGGIHVEMPDVAPDPCPRDLPGWTTRQRGWISKPGNTGAATDQFAIRLTQDMIDLWQARKSALTAAQRTWVQNHVDTAADLAADWLSTDPQGNQVLDETADMDPDP